MSILNIGQFIIKYSQISIERVKQLLIFFFRGSIKWHYHSQLFQPITLLTLLFDLEIFLYVFDFLEKTLAFYFCYILSKKICKNKKISSLIGLFYATIIHIKIVYIMPGSAFCFASLFILPINKR